MKPSDYIRKGWTQKAYARTADGIPVGVESESAACWCALGAMHAACVDMVVDIHELYEAFTKHLGIITVPAWNDAPKRTQQEVVEAFEAIGY